MADKTKAQLLEEIAAMQVRLDDAEAVFLSFHTYSRDLEKKIAVYEAAMADVKKVASKTWAMAEGKNAKDVTQKALKGVADRIYTVFSKMKASGIEI